MRNENNPNDFSLSSAGPFKYATGDNDEQDKSTYLVRFDQFFGNKDASKLKKGKTIKYPKIIRIKRDMLKSQWYNKLKEGKFNVVPEILNAKGKTPDVRVNTYESEIVASIIINYNNKQLKNKLLRKAIAIIMNKENLKATTIKKHGVLIDGPFCGTDLAIQKDFIIKSLA